jgi:hypothetical protein
VTGKKTSSAGDSVAFACENRTSATIGLVATAANTAFSGLTMLALMAGPIPVFAAGTDDSLLPYAVHVVKTPAQSPPLYGVYLGRGLVITAAHVANRTDPFVRIDGALLPSRTVKRGDFRTVDLTLVQVDERALPVSLRIRRMPICGQPPWPGEKVIVAIPEGTARSRVISPLFLPANARGFNTVIKDVATTGNSGSGVFDLGQKCLLGIMSRKIQETVLTYQSGSWRLQNRDVAKYFVPQSTIKDFIPAGLLD